MKKYFISLALFTSMSAFAGHYEWAYSEGYGKYCCQNAKWNASAVPHCNSVTPSSVRVNDVCGNETADSTQCHTTVYWFCNEDY